MDWGNGASGQLGNGGSGDSDVPVTVSGLSGVTAIANGLEHRLALLGDGTVMAWGANFAGAQAVDFGPNGAASFKVSSPTSITATSPPGTTGTVDVTVRTIGGTSAPSASDRFTYGPPTITRLSPDSGSTAGGETVTIAGTGFGSSGIQTAFAFGSAPAANVECDSTTQCTVVSPPHHAGVVRVSAYVDGIASRGHPRFDRLTYRRG